MAFSYGNEIDMYRGNQNRNCGRYTQTLFGQSIQENPVPVWTTNKEHKPFVVFQDPKSRKMIGISKDKLAYGTLIVGDPGGGKTNLINMPVNRLLATLGSNDVLIIFDPKGDYYREFWNVIPEKAQLHPTIIVLRKLCHVEITGNWCIQRTRMRMHLNWLNGFTQKCRVRLSQFSRRWQNKLYKDYWFILCEHTGGQTSQS